MGIVQRFQSAAQAVSLATSMFVAQEGMESGTLPAAEPPRPTPTEKDTGGTRQEVRKEFSVGQTYQEIGRLKGVVDSIDLFFKTNPNRKEELAQWQNERENHVQYASEIEKALEGTPSSELRNSFGRALSLNSRSLSLYLNSLVNQAPTLPNPASDRVQPRSSTAGNVAPPREGPPTRNDNLPPVVGMYDRTQFLGLRNGAALLGPLLEAEFKKGGKELTPVQQNLLDGITKIKGAKDPDQLSEELMQEVGKLATYLKQMRDAKPKEGSGGSPGLVNSIDSFLEQLGIESPRKVAPAPETEVTPEAVERSKDPANAWYNNWAERVNRDKTLRLHPGGKEGLQVNQFGNLLDTKAGFTMVKDGANAYKAILTRSANSEQYATLIKSLDQIIAAKSKGDLNNMHKPINDRDIPTFEDLKEALKVMREAKAASEKESISQ